MSASILTDDLIDQPRRLSDVFCDEDHSSTEPARHEQRAANIRGRCSLANLALIQIYLLIHNTIGPLLAEVTPLAMLCGSNASTLGPFQIRAVTLSRFQHRPATGFRGLNGP